MVFERKIILFVSNQEKKYICLPYVGFYERQSIEVD